MLLGTYKFHTIFVFGLSVRFVFFFTFVLSFFFFFKSLLVACPTHTYPPGSGLGTRGIVFDKHIDKSTQQMNLKVHSYIFFTMSLAVKHSISSSWSSSWISAVVTHSMSSSRLAFSRMLLLAVSHSIYSSQWIPLHFFCSRWILAWIFFSLFCFVRCF